MLVASLPIAFKTGKPPGLQLNCKAFQIQRATLSTKGALGNITKVTSFVSWHYNIIQGQHMTLSYWEICGVMQRYPRISVSCIKTMMGFNRTTNKVAFTAPTDSSLQDQHGLA